MTTLPTTNPMFNAGHAAACDELNTLHQRTQRHLATAKQASADYCDAWIAWHELSEEHGWDEADMAEADTTDLDSEEYTDDEPFEQMLKKWQQVTGEVDRFWDALDQLPFDEQLVARNYASLMRYEIAYEHEAELQDTEIPALPARTG